MINQNRSAKKKNVRGKKSHITKISKKKGLPPGSPIYVGDKQPSELKVTLFNYTEHEWTSKETTEVTEIYKFLKQPSITWLNIDGHADISFIERICSELNIHPLTLEDILNTEQRPKIDDFGDYLYIVLKMLSHDPEHEVVFEQISILLGNNFVISFQERPGDILDVIRERIKQGKTIRRSGADYLLYSIIDVIVDSYFGIIESTGDALEVLEEKMISNPSPEMLKQVYDLKSDIIFVRKAVWPLRDIISKLERRESILIMDGTQKYIRDVYDHAIQVIDILETQRDLVAGLLDLYLSSLSNKMNEIMKVLTIIATITIPMTVISGVYGMNFEVMPETQWIFGYPFALSLMLAVAVIMFVYFRKKQWF